MLLGIIAYLVSLMGQKEYYVVWFCIKFGTVMSLVIDETVSSPLFFWKIIGE